MGDGSSEAGGGRVFSVAIPAAAAELPPARHDFTAWLRSLRIDDEDAADLEVVYSELVTNAIAASDGPSSRIATHAWCEDGTVVLEITNGVGETTVDDHRWDMADQLRQGGRGLVIVRAFADEVEVDRDADGAVVIRCRRAVRPAGRDEPASHRESGI